MLNQNSDDSIEKYLERARLFQHGIPHFCLENQSCPSKHYHKTDNHPIEISNLTDGNNA